MLFLALISIGLTSTAVVASAAAANPCSYTINYFCAVTSASTYRATKSATASANYAHETDSRTPMKTVGYLPAGSSTFKTISATATTVGQVFSRRATTVYCSFGTPLGVVGACYYKS